MCCRCFNGLDILLFSELLVSDVRLEVPVPGADGGVPAGVHEQSLGICLFHKDIGLRLETRCLEAANGGFSQGPLVSNVNLFFDVLINFVGLLYLLLGAIL